MKTILFPTDFSENANNALPFALELAARTGGTIKLLHVFHFPTSPYEAMAGPSQEDMLNKAQEEVEKQAREIVDSLPEERRSLITIEPISSAGFATDQIVRWGEEAEADIIIMGTEGAHGIQEVVMGSLSARVIEKSDLPVLVIPDEAKFDDMKYIAFATDLNEEEEPFMQQLLDFAHIFGTEISLVHVATNKKEMEDKLNAGFLKRVIEDLKDKDIYLTVIENDSVTEGLEEYIQTHNVDLLAMLTHRRGFFQKLFQRSDTKKMAFHTKVPLLAFQA